MELAELLQSAQLTESEVQRKASRVYEQVLGQSQHLRCGNFASIHVQDLKQLWLAYDQEFFDGCLRRALGSIPLRFRLSRRLTSSAGKTTRRFFHGREDNQAIDYEICVSTALLFQTFLDVDRPVTASGIPCRDRLEALQRVFEHELIHLSEMLVWSESQCAARRFQSIAGRLFGHREHTHQLITQRERAWAKLGLKVGDRVRFQLEGRLCQGVLNRITRRATVLVEDERGVPYTNGKRYMKFYVPLALLEKDPS